MSKHTIKIYLKTEEIKKLKDKAKQLGLKERGAISHYISKIANEPIAFIDEQLKKLLKDKRG